MAVEFLTANFVSLTQSFCFVASPIGRGSSA
jgi:hypothetical protein